MNAAAKRCREWLGADISSQHAPCYLYTALAGISDEDGIPRTERGEAFASLDRAAWWRLSIRQRGSHRMNHQLTLWHAQGCRIRFNITGRTLPL